MAVLKSVWSMTLLDRSLRGENFGADIQDPPSIVRWGVPKDSKFITVLTHVSIPTI